MVWRDSEDDGRSLIPWIEDNVSSSSCRPRNRSPTESIGFTWSDFIPLTDKFEQSQVTFDIKEVIIFFDKMDEKHFFFFLS